MQGIAADRKACVDLSDLPLQLLLQKHPQWRKVPVAVVSKETSQGQILIPSTEAKKRGVTNIEFLKGDICNINGLGLFDVIIISGTLIYLTNEQAARVMFIIENSLGEKGRVFVREATGIKKGIRQYESL